MPRKVNWRNIAITLKSHFAAQSVLRPVYISLSRGLWSKEKTYYYLHKAPISTTAKEASRNPQYDPAIEEPVRAEAVPEAVAESRKLIRFIVRRMEEAVANHEFEKARFYSDVECKERAKLRLLYQEHGLSGWPFN